MLKIRKEQMDILTKDAERRFEQKLVDHLVRHFPDETKSETPESLRLRIKLHISTARAYAITTRQDIIDFSVLCVLLGDHFHNELEWAKSTLTDAHNEGVKMTVLKDTAVKYLQDIDSPHGE